MPFEHTLQRHGLTSSSFIFPFYIAYIERNKTPPQDI